MSSNSLATRHISNPDSGSDLQTATQTQRVSGQKELAMAAITSTERAGHSPAFTDLGLSGTPLETQMLIAKAVMGRMKVRNFLELVLRSYHRLLFLSSSPESAKSTWRTHPWHEDILPALSVHDLSGTEY